MIMMMMMKAKTWRFLWIHLLFPLAFPAQTQFCRVKHIKMDFSFEDLPSTSQSTPKKGHEDSQLSEDTDFDFSRERSSDMNMMEVQEQHGSSSIDDISRRAQEMVEGINHSRASDQKVMDGFQEKLTEKVTEICQQMTEQMYTVYEKNSDMMQVKLQELSEVLDSCSKLYNELREASQALACLKEGLAISQRSDP